MHQFIVTCMHHPGRGTPHAVLGRLGVALSEPEGAVGGRLCGDKRVRRLPIPEDVRGLSESFCSLAGRENR